MNNIKSTGLYGTTDLYTAAVLMSCGHKVVEVINADSKTKRFHFQDSPALHIARMSYLNGTLEGNIKNFKNAIEAIKDMIYSS